MLDYCLDITDDSFMHVYIPDATALSFPFCLYEEGYFKSGRNYYTIRDNKPMYLIIYTISGCGTVKIDGKSYSLPTGSAVLIDCRRLHEYRTASGEPWCFHWVHFDGPAMGGYHKMLVEDFGVLHIAEELHFESYLNRIHDIEVETNATLRCALFSDIMTSVLLVLGNSRYFSNYNRESNSDVVQTVCKYIKEHLGQHITVDELAEQVNLSKFYFIRLFKRYMGVSPYQYVQIMRINRAKDLLLTSQLRISEISDIVGFSSPTRFVKFFSELTGVHPTKFRKTTYSMMTSFQNNED